MKIIQVDDNIELHELQLSDAENIFNAINSQRDYLGKWLPFVEFTRSIDDSREFVKSIINAPAESQNYTFSIQYKEQFAGLIGFNYTDNANKCTEIGYWLCEQYQGKGVMTKSVNVLCDFAFTKMEMNRVQINCGKENTSSRNIPVRLGFVCEGIARERELLTGNKFTDIAIYSKLKLEWEREKRNSYAEQRGAYNIRRANFSDIEALIQLFKETVLSVNTQDYTLEEVVDWASCGDDLERWKSLITDLYFLVAENELGHVVGYASVSKEGYLHSLFIHKEYQRKGIAKSLYAEIEKYARDRGMRELTSEVSITAKPFFEKQGFHVYKVQNRKANQLYLKNYKMRKLL